MKKIFTQRATPFAIIALSMLLWLPMAGAQMQPPMGKPQDSASAPASMPVMVGMDMKAMMKGNSDQMGSMKMTGNPDIDFAMMMKIHHQGAIDMAQAQLRDGKDPQMRKMATAIIAAQKKEIAQFDRFLAKSGHDMKAMSK